MPDHCYIQSYVSIRKDKVVLNGQVLSEQNLPAPEQAKALYQYLQLDYPKFFKMDELCKLAFIAAELVLKEHSLNTVSENEIAVILANASSTLFTDQRHQESIRDDAHYFPSPAVFVYTLPNITIGEIAIRHKIKGENTFFIQEQYDLPFMHRYVASLFRHQRAKKILSGWIEFNSEGYEAFLYLAGGEKTGISLPHLQENIDKLYKTAFPA